MKRRMEEQRSRAYDDHAAVAAGAVIDDENET
jgi:hypothetical protein